MGYRRWNTTNLTWSGKFAVQLKWDEAVQTSRLVVDAIENQPGRDVLAAIQSLPKQDKKRFIDLVVTFKNNIKVYEGRKSIKDDLEITVEDVQMVIKEVLDIDIIAENIHV